MWLLGSKAKWLCSVSRDKEGQGMLAQSTDSEVLFPGLNPGFSLRLCAGFLIRKMDIGDFHQVGLLGGLVPIKLVKNAVWVQCGPSLNNEALP